MIMIGLLEFFLIFLKGFFSNVQGEVDLSWLTEEDHEKVEAPKTVYVLSFDGDPTAAGVSLLQQARM